MFAPARWTYALLAAAALGCGGGEPADEWALGRSLVQASTVVISTPRGEAEALALEAARDLEQRTPYEVRWVPADAPARGSALRIWVGDASTPGADPLLERLGLRPQPEGSFVFDGRTYDGERSCLVATFEDPRSPGRPLTVVFANRAPVAARLLSGLTPTFHCGFRTWVDGQLERQGRLSPRGKLLPGQWIDVGPLREREFRSRRLIDRGDFEVLVADALAPGEVDEDWLERQQRALERSFELLAGTPEERSSRAPLRVRLYSHPELKARITRDPSLSHVDPLSNEVHTVFASDVIDDSGYGLARAQASSLRGRPAAAWLSEGVAAASVQRWWGRPIDEWLAHLHAGGLTPPVAELLSPAAPSSPHLRIPMRGALVRLLAEEEGAGEIAALWSGDRRLDDDPARLQSALEAWLDRRVAEHGTRLDAARATRLAAATSGPMRKGINLCQSVDRAGALFDGFGSRTAEQSLFLAQQLGADALALVTRAWVEPSPPEFAADAPLGRTPDLAVATTVEFASGRGMRAMLKPQLLVTPAGNWAGAAMMTTRDNQERFFEAFAESTLHHALLAELLPGCEILCLGSEIPGATETRVSELKEREWPYLQLRRDGWRRAIDRARGAFTGALTYSARWGRELRAIEFWPELDFVAQNLFSPLAPAEDPLRPPRPGEVAANLTWALRNLSEVALEHGRPALVTEVGSSSTDKAWREPSRAVGAVSPATQRGFYEGLKAALERADDLGLELAGVYVWNWSCDFRAGGSADGGFTPQNKPAEKVLERIFSKP